MGCSFVADQVAHPARLHARDTTIAFASRAPQAEIQRLKQRHGWGRIPWYTITDNVDKDFDVNEWHGTTAFIGNRIFRTYFINNRGDEQMGSTWNYLDITASDAKEEWEDSPEGYAAVPVVELPRFVRRGDLIGTEYSFARQSDIEPPSDLAMRGTPIGHPESRRPGRHGERRIASVLSTVSTLWELGDAVQLKRARSNLVT